VGVGRGRKVARELMGVKEGKGMPQTGVRRMGGTGGSARERVEKKIKKTQKKSPKKKRGLKEWTNRGEPLSKGGQHVGGVNSRHVEKRDFPEGDGTRGVKKMRPGGGGGGKGGGGGAIWGGYQDATLRGDWGGREVGEMGNGVPCTDKTKTKKQETR